MDVFATAKAFQAVGVRDSFIYFAKLVAVMQIYKETSNISPEEGVRVNSQLSQLLMKTHTNCHWNKRHTYKKSKHKLSLLKENKRHKKLSRKLSTWSLTTSWMKASKRWMILMKQFLLKEWTKLQIKKLHLTNWLKLKLNKWRSKLLTHVRYFVEEDNMNLSGRVHCQRTRIMNKTRQHRHLRC